MMVQIVVPVAPRQVPTVLMPMLAVARALHARNLS